MGSTVLVESEAEQMNMNSNSMNRTAQHVMAGLPLLTVKRCFVVMAYGYELKRFQLQSGKLTVSMYSTKYHVYIQYIIYICHLYSCRVRLMSTEVV